VATFTRPGAPSCEQFAALAPQLQALAEALDSDVSRELTTAEIFQALDPPFLTLVKTATDNISALGFFQPVSFDVGFATVEATNNGGITQGTLVPGDNPAAMVIPNTVSPRWYYCGIYIQMDNSFANTQWKLRLRVTNVDPVTGFSQSTFFVRAYEAPTAAGTGNEYMWADFLFSSTGGRIVPEACIANTVTTELVQGGRMWCVQIAPRR
jgi:hypothetical protein